MEKLGCKLVLSDGSVYSGEYCTKNGGLQSEVCELVFNTSMFGYQNIISDRSNAGKIVLFAYPAVGNYGITHGAFDIFPPAVGGVAMRECCMTPSAFASGRTLSNALDEYSVPSIQGIPTRTIVNKLRRYQKKLYAVIVPETVTNAEAFALLGAGEKAPKNSVASASCKNKWYYRTAGADRKISVLDLGIDAGTVEILSRLGCNVTIYPYDTDPDELIADDPDGVIISNGAGELSELENVRENVKKLVSGGKTSVFAIGLGMDVLMSALGIPVVKLKTAHRGSNHAVKCTDLKFYKTPFFPDSMDDLIKPRTCTENSANLIVNQNHAYVPAREAICGSEFREAFVDIVSGATEGIYCPSKCIMATEFNPDEKILSSFVESASGIKD